MDEITKMLNGQCVGNEFRGDERHSCFDLTRMTGC